TESEQSAGQGYPPTWRLREHGVPVSLSQDTSVWWSGDLFSAMRTTLGADRAREHLEAHGRQDTVTHCRLRAEEVVGWATRGRRPGTRACTRRSRRPRCSATPTPTPALPGGRTAATRRPHETGAGRRRGGLRRPDAGGGHLAARPAAAVPAAPGAGPGSRPGA